MFLESKALMIAFPRNYWRSEENCIFWTKSLARHFGIDPTDLNKAIIKENELYSMYEVYNSLYKLAIMAFPERDIKEWEMKTCRNSIFNSEEKCAKTVAELAKKEKKAIDDLDIPDFENHGLANFFFTKCRNSLVFAKELGHKYFDADSVSVVMLEHAQA
jgi:hypothetical protein